MDRFFDKTRIAGFYFSRYCKDKSNINILSGGRKGLSRLYPYLTRLRKDSLIVLSEQSFLRVGHFTP